MPTKPRLEIHGDFIDFLPHSLYVHAETRVPRYLQEELGEMDSLGPITKKVLVGYKGRIYMVEYEEIGVHIHTNACRLIIKELPESVNSTCIVQGYDRSVIPTAAKIIADRYLDDHPELLYK
jgi:hypothetical protein